MQAINPWIPLGIFVGASAFVMFVAGLIKGDGDIDQWAGLDWTTVDWGDAGQTVLVSAIVFVVVMPLLYLALRPANRGLRVAVMLFIGLMIWVPIGLIAPGGAFGEDQSATQEEVTAALEARASRRLQPVRCAPRREPGVRVRAQQHPATSHSPAIRGSPVTSRAGSSEDDPAWKQNVGYQIAGLAGIAILGLIGLATFATARAVMPEAPPDWRTA